MFSFLAFVAATQLVLSRGRKRANPAYHFAWSFDLEATLALQEIPPFQSEVKRYKENGVLRAIFAVPPPEVQQKLGASDVTLHVTLAYFRYFNGKPGLGIQHLASLFGVSPPEEGDIEGLEKLVAQYIEKWPQLEGRIRQVVSTNNGCLQAASFEILDEHFVPNAAQLLHITLKSNPCKGYYPFHSNQILREFKNEVREQLS